MGLIGHELNHAYQFETGKVSLRADNSGYGSLYDIGDETEAYNRERTYGTGIQFFTNPTVNKWGDNNVKEYGKTMTPPAYQTLPPGPIDINSIEGVKMRIQTSIDGMFGRPSRQVYKGWQNDYNNGKVASQ